VQELEHASEFADPQAPDTFERSRITWSLIDGESQHSAMLRLYRELIALRKRWPCLSNGRKDLTRVQVNEQARWLRMDRADPSGSRAVLICSFSPHSISLGSASPTADFDFDPANWELAFSSPLASLYVRDPT
jgi:maltooligosyltrehalose trehalohydrolase